MTKAGGDIETTIGVSRLEMAAGYIERLAKALEEATGKPALDTDSFVMPASTTPGQLVAQLRAIASIARQPKE